WFNLLVIFFVTLGPLKVIPVFVQLTQGASRQRRTQLATRSAVISTIVLILVLLLGQNILRVWKINLPALMMAGGLLLCLVSLQIIMTQYEAPKLQELEATPTPALEPGLHLAVTPLAFPTILPPFGIAIALTLMVMSKQLGLNHWEVGLALLLVMGINLVAMLAARPIMKFIRPVTLKILGFTLGVMQLALGISFILNGINIQILVWQLLLRNSPL
ncbi:MAG: MarC family protein, partial [Leptolyngbyaceae cyanobacterium SM2_3_12]|nr:MarC family protein [Leptolyngbyaceae cyanobacterium SM2_3_12]